MLKCFACGAYRKSGKSCGMCGSSLIDALRSGESGMCDRCGEEVGDCVEGQYALCHSCYKALEDWVAQGV